jgi:hypothetical protein
MKWLALILVAAACGGGSDTTNCTDDACSPNVCARNGECDPASDIRTLHVVWTVNSMAADATTCAPAPDLELDFISDFEDSFGFAPVPCMEGAFTIDRIPTRFTQVELGPNGDPSQAQFVDGNDTVTFDLMF